MKRNLILFYSNVVLSNSKQIPTSERDNGECIANYESPAGKRIVVVRGACNSFVLYLLWEEEFIVLQACMSLILVINLRDDAIFLRALGVDEPVFRDKLYSCHLLSFP